MRSNAVYLPVPRISRDLYVFPAMVKGESCGILTASDGLNDFDGVPLLERGFRIKSPLDDFQIDLAGHASGRNLQFVQKLLQREDVNDFFRFAVEGNLHLKIILIGGEPQARNQSQTEAQGRLLMDSLV